MALKIITDSASDIPRSIIEEYGLHVIPTPVVIEGEDYLDGKNLFPEEFYDLLRKGKDVKTYHINSFMFHNHFEPYAKNGDEVLYLCFSTGIAGTFNAANLAKAELQEEYPDFKLTILDTRCASIGFGLITFKLLQMQKNHAPDDLIREAASFFCDHMKHVVTVETLEYLHKGGRLNKTSAVVGGILDLKPIIEVDENGALTATEKVRGRHKSLKRLVEIVGMLGCELDKQVIGICHGDDEATSIQVEAMLMERYHCKGIVRAQVGCAIGAHTGPGVIGIVFLDASEEKFREYFC